MLATFRWTNSSPGPQPRISSAGTRESEHPIHSRRGRWPCASREKNSGSRARRSSAQRRFRSSSSSRVIRRVFTAGGPVATGPRRAPMPRLKPALDGFLDATLRIRPGEGRRTALLFTHLLLAASVFILGRTVRDTLFLSRLSNPLRVLPWMFVAYGVASSITVVLYSRVADRMPRQRIIVAFVRHRDGDLPGDVGRSCAPMPPGSIRPSTSGPRWSPTCSSSSSGPWRTTSTTRGAPSGCSAPSARRARSEPCWWVWERAWSSGPSERRSSCSC